MRVLGPEFMDGSVDTLPPLPLIELGACAAETCCAGVDFGSHGKSATCSEDIFFCHVCRSG